MNCIFCQILNGQAPGHIVYRDEHVAAFMDIRPIREGHTLVVPVQHRTNLSKLEPPEAARMFKLAQRLAATMHAGAVPCDGVNLFLADGKAAGQEVFHSHLHVIPCNAEDESILRLPKGYGDLAKRKDLSLQAERLRQGLEELWGQSKGTE